MSLLRYIKEVYLYILAAVLAVIVIAIFLSVFPLPAHAIIFVAIIIAAVFAFFFIREYTKRKRYYGELLELFERLDKKFLIAELMEEGSFADAEILYELLKQTGKSMNDEIAFHKLKAADYADFLESWVHEIKTPISSARLTAQNNKNDITHRIDEDLARIEQYVQNVLYYARSSIVEKDYIIKKTDLGSLVKKALKENSRLLIDNAISVRMENLEITAFTDEKWVAFILGQIISNSVKYKRGHDSFLCFMGSDMGQYAMLNIRDNGIGIPAEDIPRIFEKGFTGENGRRFSKSTGMGLYLCKKLCDKLGIEIYAKSESGTELTLVLPKTDMFFQ